MNNLYNLNMQCLNSTYPKLLIFKSSNTFDVVLNDKIAYTLRLVNSGNTDLHNIVITDMLNDQLMFEKKSVFVNNKNLRNESITSGVKIPKLAPKQSCTINFNAFLIKNMQPLCYNISYASFDYLDSDNSKLATGYCESNYNILNVYYDNIIVNKTVTKSCLHNKNSFDFNITIKNIGDLDILFLIFKLKLLDIKLPVITDFRIGNKSYDFNLIILNKGIPIQNIKTSEEVFISFNLHTPGYDYSVEDINKNSIISANYYFNLPDGTSRFRSSLAPIQYIHQEKNQISKVVYGKVLSPEGSPYPFAPVEVIQCNKTLSKCSNIAYTVANNNGDFALVFKVQSDLDYFINVYNSFYNIT